MTSRVFVSILLAASAMSAAPAAVTFHKDVLPVLQRNCQSCHRPGEAGPMSFLTYKDSRPWAKAIKAAVLSQKMPPWFADPKHGRFSNDRSLPEKDKATLIAWADAGAPEGNAKDAPPPKKWLDGWNIGQPDKVFGMPQPFGVQADGTIEYHYVVLPGGFKEDTWVSAAEVRPGNREVVHHVIAFIRPPGSKWMAEAQPGVPYLPKRGDRRRSAEGQTQTRDPQQGEGGGGGDRGMLGSELLVGYAPGLQPMTAVPGAAKLVKAGSDIVLQMHWTANGKATTDQTKVGLIFAKEPPQYRQLTMNAAQARFAIPPGDANYEVKSQITLNEQVDLVWLMPHMHLRGKDFLYTAVFPTGEKQILLNVPRYDFNWQLGYVLEKPMTLPKGTRIECVAHFDNSPNNKYNPDPKKEVRWGDQSWEEMMIGWFEVAINPKADPADIYRSRQRTGEE